MVRRNSLPFLSVAGAALRLVTIGPDAKVFFDGVKGKAWACDSGGAAEAALAFACFGFSALIKSLSLLHVLQGYTCYIEFPKLPSNFSLLLSS